MTVKPSIASILLDSLQHITDPRMVPRSRHLLIDILFIALCAVIAGADGWEAMESFGKFHEKWLRKWLKLPNGIPHHDTFRRIFECINAKEFSNCFFAWMRIVAQRSNGEIIAIDGKTSRHSYDTELGKKAIHMVSAWSALNRLVLGQVKTDSKSNEITAIPELLKLMDIRGCIVTIDAMGCQKKIAKEILKKKGDFLFSLKGNQGSLHDDVKLHMNSIVDGELKDVVFEKNTTIEKGHGRIEIRTYWHTETVDWLIQRNPDWTCIGSIGVVESTRTIREKTTVERRYYIGSFKMNAKLFATAARQHWGIENQLHWSLDMVFKEDACRIRNNNSPQNLAIVRHMAKNLVRKEKTLNASGKAKMFRACMDISYLEKIILTALED